MNEVIEYQSKPVVPFADAWQEAEIYANSGMVHNDFRSPEACYVAMRMAEQMGVNLFLLMQNLYKIPSKTGGKVGIEAKFAIGMINSSGLFGPLNYIVSGEGDEYGCHVEAVRNSDGLKVTGTRVTVKMAKSEGWWSKTGSHWPTMTEQMCRYRAATFFSRTECPQVLLGMQTRDEIQDTEAEQVTPLPYTPAVPHIPIDGEVVDAEFIPENFVDQFPPLRICYNTKCPAHAPGEASGCTDTDPMRKDPKNPDNPYIWHCDKFIQIGPATILKELTPGLISGAKAALGWTHEITEKAEKWQLVYKILGVTCLRSEIK